MGPAGDPVIDVALATDGRYAPHAATVVRSLLVSQNSKLLTIHLLHPPRFPHAAIHRLRQMVHRAGAALELYEIRDALVAGLGPMGRISEVMWYRLLLPDLLGDRRRVVYLDCDTLVLDDLTPLWELDLGGRALAAVSNVFPSDLRGHPARLGLAGGAYFNSGMLVMELESWRRNGHGVAVARLAREQPERLLFPDQDALNIVLADSWLSLLPRWNAQNSVFYFAWARDTFGADAVREARLAPAILHFEGPAQAKPWHRGSTHPYRQTYLALQAQTPWRSAARLSARLHSPLRWSLR